VWRRSGLGRGLVLWFAGGAGLLGEQRVEAAFACGVARGVEPARGDGLGVELVVDHVGNGPLVLLDDRLGRIDLQSLPVGQLCGLLACGLLGGLDSVE
jgi:hypothetical protein